jgi:nitrogen fixation NifU-like protein
MTDRSFDFWNDHSTQFLEMAFRCDRREVIAHPDGYGKRIGACKDTIEMFLIVRDQAIQTVAYQTDGCLHTNACANTVAYLAEGRTISEAWEITPEAVSDYLQTLPVDHFHCAELAVGALYQALADYNECIKQPWKRCYR